MKKTKILVGFATLVSALGAASTEVIAQERFDVSGRVTTWNWPNRDWDGKHAFQNVYCTEFPSPSTVERVSNAMFRGGGIYLTHAQYPEGVSMFVVVSSVPEGRSAEDELSRIFANEKRHKAQRERDVEVTELQTAFGKAVGVTFINVFEGVPEGPYPLIRPFLDPPDGKVHTLGVHRTFVRLPDRFEIVAFQTLEKPAARDSVAPQKQKLTQAADQAVSALQACTGKLPVRTRNPNK